MLIGHNGQRNILEQNQQQPPTTPKPPTLLSRIIASLFSGEWPPASPSQVSMKPSRCSALVIIARAIISKYIHQTHGEGQRKEPVQPVENSPYEQSHQREIGYGAAQRLGR